MTDYTELIEALRRCASIDWRDGMCELKPCPFCGRTVKMETFVINEPFTMSDFGYEIKCPECGIVFMESTPMLPSLMEKIGSDRKYKEILMFRWNRRAET